VTHGRLDISAGSARHAGLFLDKFLPGEESQGKTELVQGLKRIAGANLASRPYQLAFERWRSWWDGVENVVCVPGTVKGRLVTGLGAESVIENGLRLHFTYGTPVIPGSTLKGVLRKAMPPEHLNKRKEGGRNIEWYLFGGDDHEGAACFEDAWWVPSASNEKALALDVLTPHHSDYMAKLGPPTDFDEPPPVHFLTVASMQKFLFIIKAPTAAWKKYLEGLLRDALVREGIGAKRSAGYGIIEVS
jgi:CRISPR-associated protein Cmr6